MCVNSLKIALGRLLYFEVNLIAILLGDLNLHAKFFCHSIQWRNTPAESGSRLLPSMGAQ